MSAHGLTDDFLQRAQHALGQDFLRLFECYFCLFPTHRVQPESGCGNH